jgi:hypothetical protein
MSLATYGARSRFSPSRGAAPRERGHATTRGGYAAGLALVAALVAAVAATHRAHPAAGSPIDPTGAWQSVWILSVVGAFALYGLGVLLGRRGALRMRFVVAIAVFVQLAPFAGPLLLSRDVFLYWAEARVVTVHHANPYVVTPDRYPDDPGTRQASVQWRTQTEPYGPIWVALGSVPSLLAGDSPERAQLLYRALAALGILTALALVARRTRSARAIAFLGWNPLIALHYAGGGHSDAWLAVALVTAVAWRSGARGGAAWALGSAIKGVPAILLPLELARTRLRVSRWFVVGLLCAGLTTVASATAVFGFRWMTASAIGAHGTSPIGGVHLLTSAGVHHREAVLIGALLFGMIYVALMRDAWRTGRARFSLAASALCMCSSLLRPWYALWPVALAAVDDDPAAEVVAYALCAYVLFCDAIPI